VPLAGTWEDAIATSRADFGAFLREAPVWGATP